MSAMHNRDDAAGVLYVIGTLDVGGTECQLVALASHLDRTRYSPRVCCVEHLGRMAAPLREEGVPVEEVPFRGLSALRNPVATGRQFLRLVGLMRRTRPAIVHTFLPHANALGVMAARLARVPAVIISRRGLTPELPVWGFLAARLADVVLTNAEAIRGRAIQGGRLPPGKVRVIRNGLDLCAFQRAMRRPATDLPQGRLVITVANPNRFKVSGLLVLVEAATSVLRQVPGLRFVLVGDGSHRADIAAAAASRGLGGRFVCLGARSDVPAILAASEVMVLPSFEEGLPNALLEAMAAGLPVVATAVGGIPEVVVHGDTGLLVPPGEPDALAAALLWVLGHPSEAHAMAVQGQARVAKHFPLDQMVQATADLYAELLALTDGRAAR